MGFTGGRHLPERTSHPCGRSPSRLIPVFVALLLVLAGCQAPEPPLRVATIHWIGYQPLHLAQSLGYFDARPVRLADFYSNTESLRAFRNRDVEVAALTLDEVLLLRSDGHDARVILVMDYSQGADAIVARPEIQDLAALKGRRVGVESTAAGAYLLARALEFGGLTTADVTIIKVGAGSQEQAYQDGRVDAIVTYEPLRTRLLRMGGRELFNSTDMPGEIIDVLVTRSDVIATRGAALADLLKGWFRVVEFAARQPEEAARQLAQRLELSPEEFRQAVAGLRFPDLEENCELMSGSAPHLSATVARLHGLMRKMELIGDGAEAPEDLLDVSLLQRLGCVQPESNPPATERGG